MSFEELQWILCVCVYIYVYVVFVCVCMYVYVRFGGIGHDFIEFFYYFFCEIDPFLQILGGGPV